MKTKKVIEALLRKTPHLKNSDNKLIATYWWKELKEMGMDADNITAMKLLTMYADSALTNVETIRRMRAKLQEEKPELRGKVYNARKGIIQEQWKKDLGYEVSK